MGPSFFIDVSGGVGYIPAIDLEHARKETECLNAIHATMTAR